MLLSRTGGHNGRTGCGAARVTTGGRDARSGRRPRSQVLGVVTPAISLTQRFRLSPLHEEKLSRGGSREMRGLHYTVMMASRHHSTAAAKLLQRLFRSNRSTYTGMRIAAVIVVVLSRHRANSVFSAFQCDSESDDDKYRDCVRVLLSRGARLASQPWSRSLLCTARRRARCLATAASKQEAVSVASTVREAAVSQCCVCTVSSQQHRTKTSPCARVVFGLVNTPSLLVPSFSNVMVL
ncbi:hypothetical protein B566_EDAN014966 [Ephemera danica]|nr:hypothetical protein B566_EDAN014966 [Ephemera danica]